MSEEVGIVIIVFSVLALMFFFLAYFYGYHEGCKKGAEMEHKKSLEIYKREIRQLAAKPVPKIGDVTEYKIDTVKCRNYYPMQLIGSLSQDELDDLIKNDLTYGLSKSLIPYISYYAERDFKQDMYMVHGMIKVLNQKKVDQA